MTGKHAQPDDDREALAKLIREAMKPGMSWRYMIHEDRHVADVIIAAGWRPPIVEPERPSSPLSRLRPRLLSCIEQWPGCIEGEYNPSCCRFPKSCSCTVYGDDIPPEMLEADQ